VVNSRSDRETINYLGVNFCSVPGLVGQQAEPVPAYLKVL
jgi:hypothetical protein